MVFVGIDWAEAHHDVCVLDDEGQVWIAGALDCWCVGLLVRWIAGAVIVNARLAPVGRETT